MNYFTHGYRFVHDNYFLAGTAVPDWLSVVDRKVRVPSKKAARFASDDEQQTAALARGIMQHHHDDRWFHNTRAFAELSLQFTVEIRDRLPADEGFRPSFLGHILVELLLDAVLIDEMPGLLDAYYESLDTIEPARVARTVGRISGRDAGLLDRFIPAFLRKRFLYDYQDDAKLLYRLNNVMRRVGLPQIHATLQEFFPQARQSVRRRKSELLRYDYAADC